MRNNWINEDVIIDFEVPKSLQTLIELCEEANAKKDYSYFNYEEALDLGCKEFVTIGKMTKKQWDIIEERYGDYYGYD